MAGVQEPVVFFGTGPVAARSLRLLAKNFHIEAVVTKPRAAHHRGDMPVLELAEQLELPILEVSSKKEVSEKVAAAGYTSRVAVLIDFGIIVEQKVIDAFPMGIVNSHFSLLPQWRGADPITFAILSGQPKTGVSLMLLVEAMDEGPIIAVGEIELTPDLDTTELTSRLIGLSDKLLTDMLPKYLTGEVVGAPQEKVAATVGYSAAPTYSRKLTKKDGILDWNKPADRLEREIRAYSEWPKSRCMLGGHAVIVTKAHVEAGAQGAEPSGSGTPGELWRGSKTLGVYTAKGVLMIDELKPAGKGTMTIAAFLNGYGKEL